MEPAAKPKKSGVEADLPPRPGTWEKSQPKPVAWTIAGFDPSSGAGVTADLMTFAAHGIFGCSAITALTVQTTLGVSAVHPVWSAVLDQTLRSLQEDLPPLGVKIGMLGAADVVGTVADRIENTKSYSGEAPVIVLDPVLRSSSGASLLAADALEIFRSRLIPRVQWMTPNWNELGVLTGMKVTSFDRAEMAGRKLAAEYAGLNVVVTGGDQEDPLDVAILADGSVHTFAGEHVATRSTHGTGCAFSSALMCALALGAAPVSAVRAAKDYVRGALLHAPGLGAGKGPMGLLWPLQVAEPAGNLVP